MLTVINYLIGCIVARKQWWRNGDSMARIEAVRVYAHLAIGTNTDRLDSKVLGLPYFLLCYLDI